MLPVLEISQVLLSSTQNTPFDMSISSSRSFTPVSSEGCDVSIERTKGKGIEVRPVVFNDFLDALTAQAEPQPYGQTCLKSASKERLAWE